MTKAQQSAVKRVVAKAQDQRTVAKTASIRSIKRRNSTVRLAFNGLDHKVRLNITYIYWRK